MLISAFLNIINAMRVENSLIQRKLQQSNIGKKKTCTNQTIVESRLIGLNAYFYKIPGEPQFIVPASEIPQQQHNKIRDLKERVEQIFICTKN